MIQISSNFDSNKFRRELEKEVYENTEKQIRRKLQDLIFKGLKIRKGIGFPSRFQLNLEGPEELIEEAKRRLS